MKHTQILLPLLTLLYISCSQDIPNISDIDVSSNERSDRTSSLGANSSQEKPSSFLSIDAPETSSTRETFSTTQFESAPSSETPSPISLSSSSDISSEEISLSYESSMVEESSVLETISSSTILVTPESSSHTVSSSQNQNKYSSPVHQGTHYVLPILGVEAQGENTTSVPGTYWGYWGDANFSIAEQFNGKQNVATTTINAQGGIYFKVDTGSDLAHFSNGELVFQLHCSSITSVEIKLEAQESNTSVLLSDYAHAPNGAGWQEVRIPFAHFMPLPFERTTVLFGLHLGTGTFGITDLYWQGWFEGTLSSSSTTPLSSSSQQSHVDNYSPGPDWQLDWSDEFNGSALNSAIWHTVQTDPPYNNEQQYYTSGHDQPGSNVWVEGDRLIIEAREEFAQGNGRTYNYTSGKIESQGGVSVQYGVIAARMKLPKGSGLWAAFWMLGSNVGAAGWPNCGEIDILEGKGRLDNYASAAIHRGFNGDMFLAQDYTLPAGQRVTDDFHVYSIYWSEQVIDFKVDNVTFFSVYNEGLGESYWPFNQPFYFIINLAVGGDFDGGIMPAASDLPARLEVDWVRSYK